MEKSNLPAISPQPGTLPTLSNEAKMIYKAIVEVNSLTAFQKDAQELFQWAQDIERLATAEDIQKIPVVIDGFKTGKIYYDRFEGIQNIFRGFRWVEFKNGEFVISAPLVQ